MATNSATRKIFSPDTVSTRLHESLRVRMCEGEFSPGEIISIRRIAAEYGTSAMPAREAIRWLVTEGALVFSDSRKIIVPQLSQARFREVLFARKNLETEVSRRAFAHISSRQAAELRKIDAQVNQALDEADIQLYMRSNYQFHFSIYHRSESQVLLPLVRILWLQYGPSMRYICTRLGTSNIADDYHSIALSALAQNDCEAFCTAIAADIEQGMMLLG